jgi:hypothetical protein
MSRVRDIVAGRQCRRHAEVAAPRWRTQVFARCLCPLSRTLGTGKFWGCASGRVACWGTRTADASEATVALT